LLGQLVPGDKSSLAGLALSTVAAPSSFERFHEDYLNDDEYKDLQSLLIENPKAGDVIKNIGGLRKFRFEDKRRGKSKRGGLRVIHLI
jgi:hypothetical protein